jgi:hypothetical protein
MLCPFSGAQLEAFNLAQTGEQPGIWKNQTDNKPRRAYRKTMASLRQPKNTVRDNPIQGYRFVVSMMCLAFTNVFQKLIRRHLIDQRVRVAMGGNLMPLLQGFLDQLREMFGYPA